MGAEVIQGTPTISSENGNAAAPTGKDLEQDLLATKLHLLDSIRQGDNFYKVVAAAQAFALISGTLTSTDSVQMRSNG
jgi:hypothetical protein